MKDLKAFLEELANSEALQTGLADALKNRKLPEFMKENGCDADPVELVDFLRKARAAGENESMSPDDMDAVAGGGIFTMLHDFRGPDVHIGVDINELYDIKKFSALFQTDEGEQK